MPKIADILGAVELLRINPVSVDPDRCVAIRNRNSKCRRCSDACVADAIAVRRYSVDIDADLCLNCGACASVCPDKALAMVEPTESQVDARVGDTADPAHAMAVVACSRRASKNEADPQRFTEVPCLAHIDDCQLVSYAASGYDDIILVDGDCSTCRLGKASCTIDSALASACSILETAGSDAIITRCSEFPAEILMLDEDDRLRGSNRRGLARQTGSYMGKIAANAARRTLEDRLGPQASQNERMRQSIASNGKPPTFTPDFNYRLIDEIEAIDGSRPSDSSQSFRSRRFGNVEIDSSECTGCGLCVLFCPTEALAFDDCETPSMDGMRYIGFNASDCTQCMLCADVCLRRCIDVGSLVRIDEISDPAPRLIAVPEHNSRSILRGSSRFLKRD